MNVRNLYITILSVILSLNAVHAQSGFKITGQVIDTMGNPIIHAMVTNINQSNKTLTDIEGNFVLLGNTLGDTLEIQSLAYATTQVILEKTEHFRITLEEVILDEIVIIAYRVPVVDHDCSSSTIAKLSKINRLGVKSVNAVMTTSSGLSTQSGTDKVQIKGSRSDGTYYYIDGMRVKGNPKKAKRNFFKKNKKQQSYPIQTHQETYAKIVENAFYDPRKDPLSTLSIDVDRAAYSNVRRFLNQGQLPPSDAIRVEEMINYFDYKNNVGLSKTERPFVTQIELGSCPWNEDHQLMMVNLFGNQIEKQDIPASNFVFLVDVSGSMNSPDKLPLLKASFKELIKEMRPEDRVAIVTYAGNAGLVLESTSGTQKDKMRAAIESLRSGGSTAGAAGINLAYQIAEENFIEDGNNRIILATDGDFNVGVSNTEELIELIEEKRENDVFLSILAFGTGNYQDEKMQKIAGHGNGNHSYIDNIFEAKKVMIKEFGSTMYTIAKDVKIQIEFNPNLVSRYRMVGYENRVLAAEDFNDDKKDAGDMGAGHTVTVLYELVPTNMENNEMYNKVDPLKYQSTVVGKEWDQEIGTIKYRYKKPTGKKSMMSSETIYNNLMEDPSDNFVWASNVANFGLLLRNSVFNQDGNYEQILASTQQSVLSNDDTYRTEFVRMVEIAMSYQTKKIGED